MTEPSDPHPQPSPDNAATDDAADKLVVTSPDESTTAKDFLLWAGVIVLVTLTIYSPAIRGSFIWDDDRHVEQNKNLRDAEGLVNIWTKLGLRNGGTPQYYPITHTTFWLEYQLSGARPNDIDPTIFHVTNVILHAGSAILFWFILRELAVPGAWVAAAIFALHPLEVESVAWISERKNVLSGIFFFGAIYAYLRSGFALSPRESGTTEPVKRDWNLWGVALLLFVLALLSKSVACSMPAVMLVLIWWRRGRVTMREIGPLVPFFALGAAMAMVTGYVEREHVIKNALGVIGPDWNLSPTQRVIVAGRALWFYAGKLLWPTKLTFSYPKWTIDPSQPAQWLYPLAVVVVLAALLALRKRIGRGVPAAALIFCGVLVPALGFVDVFPMRYSYVADHFQYLAGPALIALIVAGAARLLGGRRASSSAVEPPSEGSPPAPARPLPYVLAGVVLVVLAVLTLLQSRIYAGPTTLWRDTVAKNPSSWMAQNNLGVAMFHDAVDLPPERADEEAGMLDEAIDHFHRAIELKPDHDRAYMSLGQALARKKKPDEGLAMLNRAVEINPNNADAWTVRGELLRQMNRPDEAIDSFRRGIAAAEAQRASFSDAQVGLMHQKLGSAAMDKGDLAIAQRELETAMQLADKNGRVFYEYGKLMVKKNDPLKAAEAFGQSIRLAPEVVEPHIDLALLRLSVGNLAGSRAELIEAARIDKNNPRLMDAAKKWSAAFEASTRPSTTRSSTGPSSTRGTTTISAATATATAATTRP